VSGGPPTWAPASVGAAPRFGDATSDDLTSGKAWALLLASLERAGTRMAGAPVHERASGYRHLLTLAALGIDEALRSGEGGEPRIRPGNVDNVLKWGMDCPDAAYSGTSLRGDTSYRIRGVRGTVRYVGLQVMGGMETLANVVVDDLEIAEDGSFDIVLSADEHDGNWLRLDERASTLIVRQFFYDWENELPAQLTIERTDGPEPGGHRSPDAEGTARHLVALGEFIEASVAFWDDIEKVGRAEGLNRFRDPANRTDIGGAEENVTVWGSYDIGPDDALVVTVTPPPALYWSLVLGDEWWASVDYANHQSSLNGHQAVLDSDGAFRAVVSIRDPGVANWLDTTGFSVGPMIFRWLRASSAPVPSTRVIPVNELDDALPASTARVSADERQRVLAARRAGVHRSFPR